MSLLGNYYGYVELMVIGDDTYLSLDDYSGKHGIKLTAEETDLARRLFELIGDREPVKIETEAEREAEQARQERVNRLAAEGRLKSYDPADGFGLPQIKQETPQEVLDEIAGKPKPPT